MKLYITPTSPYARVARIAVIEKGLSDRVDIVLPQTRTPNSPYYEINPSGRVPFLVSDDGAAIEDSELIVHWLDHLAGPPTLTLPLSAADWQYGRLQSYARSFTDGLSVRVRERRRPTSEQSPSVLEHEEARSERLADFWDKEVAHDLMQGPINLAQIYLLVGLDQSLHWKLGDYSQGRQRLREWLLRLHDRPSVQATAPSL